MEGIDWKKEMITEEIANLGEIRINTKTINLFAGCSLAGKTATCLHLVDSAIHNKKVVYYYDTEKKTIMNRPIPRLFEYFCERNKEGYDKYFKYNTNFDEKKFFEEIRKVKPDLIVIDSIYAPFIDTYANAHPMERAKKIKKFVNELRDYITENKIAGILTTSIGREGGEEVVLGGEGLKYVSDIKVWIQFPNCKDSVSSKDSKVYYNRFFVVDRQIKYSFKIDYGGKISIED